MDGLPVRGDGINFSTMRKNQKTMNLLLITLCFILAYGVFALIAFKVVKVLFPNNDAHDKPWRVKSREL